MQPYDRMSSHSSDAEFAGRLDEMMLHCRYAASYAPTPTLSPPLLVISLKLQIQKTSGTTKENFALLCVAI